jgi:hypothetical protein
MAAKPSMLKVPSLIEWSVPLCWCLLACWQVRAVGTWTRINTDPPNWVSRMALLSDGTILAQMAGGQSWERLTPDGQGIYVNGSWSAVASSHDSREYYSSAVLRDGRYLVAGGEYGSGGTNAEVFDPVANTWTKTPQALVGFGDSQGEILPDGRVLVSPVGWNPYPAFISVIYDPIANSWSEGPASINYQNECTWVKLPDDSILAVDDDSSATERYIPSLNQWIADASTTVNLWDLPNNELGPGFLLPDGRAFFVGGSGHTAYYTPSGNQNPGTWAAGPNIPGGRVARDAPGAMMVNGKILCVVSATTNHNPVYFYEFDPVANSFTQVASPTGGLSDGQTISDAMTMLVLPSGNLLFSDTGNHFWVYQPDGSPLASGKPTVNKVSWNSDGSLHLTGTLFNGISQGASFGDDAQMDSNYPIVRFTDGSGNVYYGRTYNWSRTSVQTGGALVTTECSVPAGVFDFPNNFSLQVVANGIASDPVTFYSPVWVDFNYSGLPFQFGWYVYPWNTLGEGVSAVATGGTIAIKSSNSHETMTISKPMTIISAYGPSTIGH